MHRLWCFHKLNTGQETSCCTGPLFFCKMSYKINFFATCFINCCNWSLVKTQSMTLVNMTCHLQRWHERQQATTGTIIKYKPLQPPEPFFHHRRSLLFTELSGVPFAACFLLHVKPFLSDPSPIIGNACHSLTNSLTHSLTHSRLVNLMWP